MLTTIYTGMNGITILENSSQAECYFVDDNLHIYEQVAYDDFAFEPADMIRLFMKATLKYFEGTLLPQFRHKAILDFNKSDFCKDTLRYMKGEER